MQTVYSYSDVSPFVSKWVDDGGEVCCVPGSLLDSYIMTGRDGFKSVVVREVYLSPWSSGYTVRRYNKLPKKYLDVIDLICDGDEKRACDLFYK